MKKETIAHLKHTITLLATQRDEAFASVNIMRRREAEADADRDRAVKSLRAALACASMADEELDEVIALLRGMLSALGGCITDPPCGGCAWCRATAFLNQRDAATSPNGKAD